MKKLLMMSLLLFACQKEEVIKEEAPKDCECDRVVERHKFNMQNQNQVGQVIYFGTYITINDCTGIQKEGDWDSLHDPEPVVGQCY